MRLQSLQLRNFKGIRDLTIIPEGHDLSVFGDNATGKTTIADAYFWLLFGKDSQNRADFEIKTLDKDGHVVHNLDHTVEGVFAGATGTVRLAKTYREKYTKQRGSATAELTGHTTDYWINGVPVKKTDYDASVAEICNEQRFRLVSDPDYFNKSLSWQQRRQILLEVCGDVAPEDVFSANPELAPLREAMGEHSMDDYRKIAKAKLRELNEKIKTIQPRIDENTRAIDASIGDAKPKDLAEINRRLNDAIDERTAIESGTHASSLRKSLAEAIAAIAERKAAINEESSRDYTAALSDLKDKETAYGEATAARDDLVRRKGQIDKAASEAASSLESKRADHAAIKAEEFVWSGSDTCITCGQPLPSGDVEERKGIDLERFNLNKAARLEKCVQEGKDLAARMEKIKADGESCADSIEKAEEAVEAASARLLEAKEKASGLKLAEPDYSSDANLAELEAMRKQILSDIENVQSSTHAELAKANALVVSLREEYNEAAAFNAKIDAAKSSRDRIAELEASLKSMSAEYERIQGILFLAEKFVRTHVEMLTDKINSKFEVARFVLFNEQVNGGIEETCVCSVDGVPYGDLNTGMKLNAGLDILDTLARHYEFVAPVFIDNAESVTQIRPTAGQQIRLVVSAPDKTMRFDPPQLVQQALV